MFVTTVNVNVKTFQYFVYNINKITFQTIAISCYIKGLLLTVHDPSTYIILLPILTIHTSYTHTLQSGWVIHTLTIFGV